MTKTDLTKQIEKALFEKFSRNSTYIAIEVKIGTWQSKVALTEKDEIVDFMSLDTSGLFRCIEIKTTKSDLKSKASLSFYGDSNYFAMPVELYNEVNNESWFKDYLWEGIGVITYESNRGTLNIVKKAKTKRLGLGVKGVLLESMNRSLARDAAKYYKHYYKNQGETDE